MTQFHLSCKITCYFKKFIVNSRTVVWLENRCRSSAVQCHTWQYKALKECVWCYIIYSYLFALVDCKPVGPQGELNVMSISRMIDLFEKLSISDCEMMNYKLCGDGLETLHDWWAETVASLKVITGVFSLWCCVKVHLNAPIQQTTFTEVQYLSDNMLIKYISLQ